ncbi:retrovirus-related pol polyprotein from transposon TNT 1-94 [Tanacetum coccineum]
MNKSKKVRFEEPKKSISNIPKQADSQNYKITNLPLLNSTVVKSFTSASGSQPLGNTKKNRISRTTSSNKKNKVGDHLRRVKSSLNKKNRVSECNASTKQDVLKENSKSVCKTCNECLFNACHDLCVVDYLNNMNMHAKSRSNSNKKKVWKPTGKVFTIVRHRWIPTGRTSTKDRNKYPLTRITSTIVVPPKKPVLAKIVKKSPPSRNNPGKPKAKTNVVQIVLWYLDSGCLKRLTGQLSQLINFISKFMGTVRFWNDQVAPIIGYGDYHIGNMTISQHLCFVRDLEGVDLLKGPWGTNLLSHLNFGAINELAKQGLFRRLPKLKYKKDHLCSACSLEKSKKHTHKPNSEDSIQEKLYFWVKFLRSKDETPEFIIKFLKKVQVHLNATVKNIRTDNGTEFVNQTLKTYYEDVGISYQNSVACTPQQNDIAEAVATACYTQNRSLIHKRHNKIPYELLHDKKPDLTYFHVFGALCYPTNDSEDLGKLKPKADIGIFIDYSPAKKAY